MAETDHSIEYDDELGDVTIDGKKYDALDLTVTSEEKDKIMFMTVSSKNGDEYLFESRSRSLLWGYGKVGEKISTFTKKLPELKETSEQEHLRAKIKNGYIPQIDTPNGILLKKDEYAIMTSENVNYCQEKTKTEYYGGGASYRVSKNLTIRGGKGVPVQHDYFAVLDTGRLTLTNKRIIFFGDRKSTTISISKICAVERYLDAVDITKEGVMKQSRFKNIDGNMYADLITVLSQNE